MATTPLSRREISARTRLLKQLKEDHKRVKDAFERFKKLDPKKDRAKCEALVNEVLDDLELHATLEEDLLYPAARAVLDADDLLDEAAVEHESLLALIGQLRGLRAGDEMYGARFTVLCEYAQHHVKEEEGEMFPQLRKAQLGWEDLASRMDTRREELQGKVEVGAAAGSRAAPAGRPPRAPISIGSGRSA